MSNVSVANTLLMSCMSANSEVIATAAKMMMTIARGLVGEITRPKRRHHLPDLLRAQRDSLS